VQANGYYTFKNGSVPQGQGHVLKDSNSEEQCLLHQESGSVWRKDEAGLHCKNICISTNILWKVFHIIAEPVPYTFVSVNQRNNEALVHIAMWQFSKYGYECDGVCVYQAVANELGLNFISVKGPELLSMVGIRLITVQGVVYCNNDLNKITQSHLGMGRIATPCGRSTHSTTSNSSSAGPYTFTQLRCKLLIG